MKTFYGHPDDPSNPQGGQKIDNDELSELEIERAEEQYEDQKFDLFETLASAIKPQTPKI